MRTRTFKKGLYTPHYKGTAQSHTVVIMPKKDEVLVYPMLQHIGEACKPLVALGDKVLVGQKIGDSQAFMSVPIHATVSGTVIDIAPALLPNGSTAAAVYIANDAEMQEDPAINQPIDYTGLPHQKKLEVIREAGIVGLGGAGFPTHIKLNPPKEKLIDTIIVNVAECEPYLTTDHRVLLEETEKILMGLQIILSLFPRAKGVIGIETNKMDGIKAAEALCKNRPFKGLISVARLKPKYPQGAEKQLIKAITRREVPSGGLPSDIGCIVQNVDTVIAIHRAFYRGRPLMRKIVTIAGGATKKPGNYKIRLGMRYAAMMNAIEGFISEPYKIVAGGPMMGTALFSLNVPIIKTSQAFLAFTEEEARLPQEHNCIRCGKCVQVCPSHLMPHTLNQYVVYRRRHQFLAENGMDCIECGCCSYTCPSKRHLAQSIRAQRREVMLGR